MNNLKYDLVIIGGGPAGLAAAFEARKTGSGSILILEREKELGGILNQCIHNGFGLHYFKEELTGPEYADRFIQQVKSSDIAFKLNTMVISISDQRIIEIMNPIYGYARITARAIVLAMGCRERARGSIGIPGTRPSGIFSAGTAQRYINIDGYSIGSKVFILGSGDIGLIMARRLTLDGAEVLGVAELMSHSSGLTRNIVQCLDDYNIPLYLSHTIIEIKGKNRIESIILAKVDAELNPIAESEMEIACDTLLLSVGLIPENELSRLAGVKIDPKTKGPILSNLMETSVEGIFACGNVVHVHDIVDYVTVESNNAGRYAMQYLNGIKREQCDKNLKTKAANGISYISPQIIYLNDYNGNPIEHVNLMFRVNKIYTKAVLCIKSEFGEIVKLSKDKMTPGEMEHVVLKMNLIPKYAKFITVEVEGA